MTLATSSTPLRIIAMTPDPGIVQKMLDQSMPGTKVHPCTRYQDLAPMIAALSPDVLLAAKLRSDTNPFPTDAIAKASSLRWLHIGGAGVEHIQPWDTTRLTVTNSSGIHGAYMAQYALAAMVSFTQHLALYGRQQRERIWSRQDCEGLAGRTITLVGFGAIGQEIARTAKFFGMRVVAVKRNPEPTEGADLVLGPDALAEAVAQADFCVLALPLTKDTRGIFSASAIAALQPHAVLINLARGAVVDEPALLEALEARRFRGAVLDVFTVEPLPVESRFWDLDNVIITPHSSSDAVGWEADVSRVFIKNLERYVASQPMERVVLPHLGY